MALPAQGPVQHPAAHDPLEGVTPEGMITTGAQRSRISPQFLPIIEQAVEQVQALHGDPSLYLYGSVATGMAQVGRSDVDLVSIAMDPAAAKEMGSALSARFASLCRGIEVGPAQAADYEGPGDEPYGNRVFLRHYCVCLAGPDIARGWPDFPADKAAARGFNGDIGRCLDRWRRALVGAPNTPVIARRIARKTLWAVSGLVSVHDTTWTTNRASAAQRWALLKPQWAGALDQLIAWGHCSNVASSHSQIQNVLDGVVADVVEEFRTRIGLWDQP